MELTRRAVLAGAGSGLTLLLVVACTDEKPTPTPTPSPSQPTPSTPVPSSILRSSWASDPFTLGATSFVPVGASADLRDIAREPLLERVFFAGEWSSRAPSTLRGAYRSAATVTEELTAVATPGERVVVVGAGLAGARAAKILDRNGFDVLVIEARDRVGGRIDSREVDGGFVELGAWRLDERLDAELLRELGGEEVESLPLEPVSFQSEEAPLQEYGSWPGEPLLQPIRAVSEASTWAQTQLSDVSLQAALAESGAADAVQAVQGLLGEDLMNHYLQLLATRSGADASELSAWFLEESDDEVGTDEGDVVEPVLPDGPMVTLVDRSLEGIDVSLSTPVVSVDYDDDGVSLRLATGESLSADRVVITTPLGVLQAGAIEFDPPLRPSRRSALNGLAVGDVEIVHVGFDEPFWSTDALVWNVVGSELEITTWIDMSSITGSPDLLGIVGGSSARSLNELDSDAVTALVSRCLAPFMN